MSIKEWSNMQYDGRWRYISALPDAFKDDVVFFHRPWWPADSDTLPKENCNLLVYYGEDDFAVKYFMPKYGRSCLDDDWLGKAIAWQQIWAPATQPGKRIFADTQLAVCGECGNFGPIAEFKSAAAKR